MDIKAYLLTFILVNGLLVSHNTTSAEAARLSGYVPVAGAVVSNTERRQPAVRSPPSSRRAPPLHEVFFIPPPPPPP
ncbi:hypothetical protein BVRB_4g095500 [Beta vulgaris subsp. vulgaris]|uniref:Uncharacterized protein n=1 Tax=Beta vulgaris subsp. vulgaris TaxID=3555 RepID=A0A0J8E4P4_BETVV|nr:hypothetical protein BVRB_4g095500 [Beta vulgaris subsp. vulgaris]